MIRKPDAKNRAELLMRELATDGMSIKRGRALDIVAKLEGHRDWNTLQAASLKRTEVAQLRDDYEVGSLGTLSHFGRVLDVTLSAHLQHSGPDDHTRLYTWTAPDGEKFELRLCGSTRFEDVDPQTGEARIYSSADGLSAEFLEAYGRFKVRPDHEYLDNPYYEWINEAGDPVADVLETVWVNVKDEVRQFQQMLVLTA